MTVRILRLIKADDDYDDFSIQRIYNQQNKLSRVLDVLGGFLKKGKSSEFNSRHDGSISGWPTPLQVLQKRKKRRRPQRAFIIFRILPKRKANLKFHFWIFSSFLLIVI